MKERKNERIAWVDIFRALMIFCIAFGHAARGGLLRQYVYSFHVAAFFFISGFLFQYNAETKFVKFFLKKAFTLLVPYCVFSLLSIAVFAVAGVFASQQLDIAIRTNDILPNILGMLYANGSNGLMKWNLPLWFVPCLFITLIAYYPFCVLLAKAKKKLVVFIAGITTVLLLCFLNYYVFHVNNLPFGLENTFYLLPFLMVGHGMRLYFDYVQLRKKFLNFLLGGICIAVGLILGIFCNTAVDYVTCSYGNLSLFYIAAFLSIIGYFYICSSDVIKLRGLYYAGQNTMPILLMHKFPIVFLQILLKKWLYVSIWGDCIAVVIAIIACILSLVVGAIIYRFVPFVLGKRKPMFVAEAHSTE